MKCRRARQHLSSQSSSRALRSHLAACPECSSFGERMDAVLVALGDHQVTIPPPSDFATRVPLSLPRDDDPLAWAALRLLPATLGLVLLLSWLNLRAAEPAAEELTDPTAEVLSWILEPSLAGAPPVGNG